MGKFINTSYTTAVNDVSNTVKTLLNNPYYMWTDKKPTLVTYYPINMERSTLDQAARIPYADVGEHSPIRYDRIKNFVIYGYTASSEPYFSIIRSVISSATKS